MTMASTAGTIAWHYSLPRMIANHLENVFHAQSDAIPDRAFELFHWRGKTAAIRLARHFFYLFYARHYQSFMTIDQKGSSPMKVVSFIAVASVSILSGCAYNAAPYGASVANVESIKSLGIKPVSVAKFSSSQPGQSSITCRAAGPVSVSPSFETYIEKALIDELKLAGAYDASSKLILNGKLEEIDFSSGITDGKWLFTITVSNARNQSFTTKSIFEFSGSFVADKACQETAQAFAPAVQKLVQDIVRNPQFRKIAN